MFSLFIIISFTSLFGFFFFCYI